MSNAGAGFIEGSKDSQGNIKPAGSNNSSSGSVTEELSEGEIREKRIRGKKEDLVIDELSGGGKVRERDSENGEKYIKVPVDNIEAQDRLNRWFDTEELSAMRQGRDLIEGRDSPDYDKDWREALKEEVDSHNQEVRERKAREEIQRLKDFAKDEKYRKDLNSLSGEEFGEIIEESLNGSSSAETQEEELAEAIDSIKEKYGLVDEPNTVEGPTEVEELAANDWSELGGVWEEFAQDIEHSDSDTEYVSVSENSRRVRTSDNELRHAILNYEEEPFDGDVTIHEYDRSTNTVEATISKE